MDRLIHLFNDAVEEKKRIRNLITKDLCELIRGPIKTEGRLLLSAEDRDDVFYLDYE